MSSSSSSSSDYSLTFSDSFNLIVIRPVAATLFVLSFILIGWALAWKLVLAHVPLVQEIFGLKRKKQLKLKPTTGRLSKIYSAMEARSASSTWGCTSLETICLKFTWEWTPDCKCDILPLSPIL